MTTAQQVLPFEDWKPRHEAEQAVKLAKPMSAKAYDPVDERPPDVPWFRLNKAYIDSEILSVFEKVMNCMTDTRVEDLELADLKNAALDVKDVSFERVKAVGIVGQQAMGKSLLINALLHRRNLSKTSAAGGACTASAIKYSHKLDMQDDGEIYDATIQFMDAVELNEIISEHARRFHHFHFSDTVDPIYHDEEERAASTAESFFGLLWNTHNDEQAAQELQLLLSAGRISNGDLQREAVKMAATRIRETGANVDRTKSFQNLEVRILMEEIQYFVAQHKTLPSLWPIVSCVSIAMGSSLLRNAVSIIDLPGLGDLNHSRTAATNSVRRKADFEIIVAKSERVMTEEVVDSQIKQSIRYHGAKNTILVLTKIDEFFLDNHSIENIISSDPDHPFPLIKRYMMDAEKTQCDVEKQINEIDGTDDDEADSTELMKYMGALSEYQEYLMTAAQCAFVQQRAAYLESQMRHKYRDLDPNPIRVFSVSSSLYIDWMKKRRRVDPVLSPEMTGIPKLRQFLLGISSESNVEAYHHHAASMLPNFLGKIVRIVEYENKNDAYAEIRPYFNELIESLKEAHEDQFASFLDHQISRLWTKPSDQTRVVHAVANIVRGWGDDTRWNTYNKFLREMGIVKKSRSKKYGGKAANWNQEISEAINPDFVYWRTKMKKEVAGIATALHNAVKDVCQQVTKHINKSSLNPSLKAIALREWKQRQTAVLGLSTNLDKDLKRTLRNIYKYASTETDTRCMISRISSIDFEEIQKMQATDGGFHKQKAAMLTTTMPEESNNKILDRIAEHFHKEARRQLNQDFTVFMAALIEELQAFDDHMGECLPPEYELTDADHEIRKELRDLLPELEHTVLELTEILSAQQKIKRELDDVEEVDIPSKRHQLISFA